MPRTQIEPQFPIEYLSILDSDGKLDASLEPELPPDDLKRLYRAMLLGRRLDERMLRAAAPGPHRHLRADQGPGGLADRQRLHACGRPTGWCRRSARRRPCCGAAGRSRSSCCSSPAASRAASRSPEQRDLPITIPVATQLPHAVGLAYAAQYRGDDAVVMVVLRRRRDLRGRLPRGAQLRRRLARAGGLRLPEQPVGHLRAAQEADALARPSPRRRWPTASRASRWTATTCWPSTRRAGRRSTRARAGGRADADRVRHLPPRRAHDGRRPDQVPLGRRGRGLGAARTRSRASAAYLEKKELLDDGLDEQVDAEIAAAVERFEAHAGRRPARRCSTTPTPTLPPDLAAQRAALAARCASGDGPPPRPPRPSVAARCAASARAAAAPWPSSTWSRR